MSIPRQSISGASLDRSGSGAVPAGFSNGPGGPSSDLTASQWRTIGRAAAKARAELKRLKNQPKKLAERFGGEKIRRGKLGDEEFEIYVEEMKKDLMEIQLMAFRGAVGKNFQALSDTITEQILLGPISLLGSAGRIAQMGYGLASWGHAGDGYAEIHCSIGSTGGACFATHSWSH